MFTSIIIVNIMLINYKEYEYNMNIVNRSSYSENNE